MQIVGPSSQTVISQRTRLHFADWGNPDAPPLLLLHGGRDHCRNWDWTAEALRGDWHVICPDLRGHGDSGWDESGNYTTLSYVYDLAQIVHQLGLSPVTIVAHSLGGNIALRYAGLYPENVRRLVAIEGLGPSPSMIAERDKTPLAERCRQWIDDKRGAAGRQPRRYATFEDALSRMQQENTHLSDAQARHLTTHAVIRNEDGTYGWKFDPYVRVWPPVDLPQSDLHGLWSRITCPTRLVYGGESWASNPEKDGRIQYFSNAEVSVYDGAGHWVHHDHFDDLLSDLRQFL